MLLNGPRGRELELEVELLPLLLSLLHKAAESIFFLLLKALLKNERMIQSRSSTSGLGIGILGRVNKEVEPSTAAIDL